MNAMIEDLKQHIKAHMYEHHGTYVVDIDVVTKALDTLEKELK